MSQEGPLVQSERDAQEAYEAIRLFILGLHDRGATQMEIERLGTLHDQNLKRQAAEEEKKLLEGSDYGTW